MNLAVCFTMPQVEPFGPIDFKQKRRDPAPTNPKQQSTVAGDTKNKADRLAPPPYSPDTEEAPKTSVPLGEDCDVTSKDIAKEAIQSKLGEVML